LQLRKSAPILASVVEVTTKRNIAYKVKNSPFNLMGGFVESVRQLMKICPHAQCGHLSPKDMMHPSGYEGALPRERETAQ
jgi:hypothetical protein